MNYKKLKYHKNRQSIKHKNILNDGEDQSSTQGDILRIIRYLSHATLTVQ